MIKKIISCLLIVVFMLSFCCSCSKKANTDLVGKTDSIIDDKELSEVDKEITLEPAGKIALSENTSAVITSNGDLYMWGSNSDGALAYETEENCLNPKFVLSDVKYVSTGSYSSAAIKNDDTLWTWGLNTSCQLGDGTDDSRFTPQQIMSDVVCVDIGSNVGMAVKNDGSLWAWGMNYHNQISQNMADEYISSPVKIMDGVKKVDVSSRMNCFVAVIKDDDSLWTWGPDDISGYQGNGSDVITSIPTKIMDDVLDVSITGSTYIVVKKDNTLWTWGNNSRGQIGDGTRDEDKRSPIKILDDVVAISAGDYHCAAIKKDGSLWLWGCNDYGMLGWKSDNPTDIQSYTAPAKIMDDVSAVSLGHFHSAAITTSGEVYTWGSNSFGKLGIGNDTTEFSVTPVKVISIK